MYPLVVTSGLAAAANGRPERSAWPPGGYGLTIVIVREVGFSARNLAEWNRLTAALASFPLIETDASHLQILASKGLRGRKIPDLLIAAAAEQSGLILLHYDADFDLISRVTGQPCEWVVPAGTVD